ncbi:MAG TPA: GDSL-type esterase/lipase family protein [Fimbriimonadaceae bacterium]|nr:GDSL-type esterase/lipase family protein [Fimbriimonadaceae bacterium]
MIATLAAIVMIAPIRVACIGASITTGVGTHDPATQSYPALLQRYLGPTYEVRGFGHSGATMTRKGDLPYWTVPEFKAAQDFQPQIVVIYLGTNDARKINWEKSKNVFVPQYKEMISVFRHLASSPKVFVCLPVPNFEERKENVDDAVVPLVRQISREADAPLIDIYTPLQNPALFPDKLHPNEEGAQLIAEAIAEAIEDPVARKKHWRVVSVDSVEEGEGPARHAIDGDTYTYWHTNYSSHETKPPHEIVVDMGEAQTIIGFRHLPRQDGGVNGRVRAFELYFSLDGKTWGSPAMTGEIPNTANWTNLKLAAPVKARYFKFRALSEWNGGPWTSVGELDVQRALEPG